ncbi:MAG: hypothetical protein DDT32_00637 [Syntrophomonadaceae bacterium]|nr:hypothetical protein [Bacillota bacterium]
MEKAKITKTISKKGKPIFKVTFEDGKSMDVPNHWFTGNETFAAQDCDVERNKGQITKVVVDGKEYKATPAPAGQQSRRPSPVQRGNNARNHNARPATAWAPYNFIPLNDKVVPAEEVPHFDRYHLERHTGYITYELEAVTPLYIHGRISSNKDGPETGDFFAPGKQTMIPGSSMRGMVRTLVEVISHGKFTNFEGDRRLYYRAVADSSSLGRAYREKMTDAADYHYPRICAGFLHKSAQVGRYEIVPCKEEQGVQFYRVEFTTVEKAGLSIAEGIFFRPVKPEVHKHRCAYLKYAEVDCISSSQISGYKRGFLLKSGKMPGKHMHWIINEQDTGKHAIEIPESVIEDYHNDRNRSEKIKNLVDQAESNSAGVPCFYIAGNDGQVSSFGHTGMFRLAYEKTIGEHVPEALQGKDVFDIAETIFGKEDRFASRVSFEDAKLAPGQDDVMMEPFFPKILSTPKPTTFQHYLVQKSTDRNSLNHWNSDAPIRGYKLYWHRDVNGRPDVWQAAESEAKDKSTQYPKRIRPVKKGTKFEGQIRFENLSGPELGALLFVLDLPEHHYHKLGMGKPLGLGSVKITPKLVLTNRKERYRTLFSEDGWYLPEDKPGEFKKMFEKYILQHLEQKVSSLWELPRLKALETMLDWNNTKISDWPEKTRYMEIEHRENGNEYRSRNVLPGPEDVTK